MIYKIRLNAEALTHEIYNVYDNKVQSAWACPREASRVCKALNKHEARQELEYKRKLAKAILIQAEALKETPESVQGTIMLLNLQLNSAESLAKTVLKKKAA